MNLLPLLNQISEIFLQKNAKKIYLCGGSGRKLLGVGINAFDDVSIRENNTNDVDIIVECRNEDVSSDLIAATMQEIVESVSGCLGIESHAAVFRSKFKNRIGRIEISMPISPDNNIEFDLKIFLDQKNLVKNRPTTLMRRKIDISEHLDEEFLETLSSSSLYTLIESGTLLIDCQDKPIRNYVALCDDKDDYLVSSEKRSYFLRRVCYDMATCGVNLPDEDIEWINKKFFPSLHVEKPTQIDIEYGMETLNRIARGLDVNYSIQLLKNNNYLCWLFDMSNKEQSILFQNIVLRANSRVAAIQRKNPL